jgi:hypothetical protein
MLLVTRDGRRTFESILDSATQHLLICAPYITAVEMNRALERLRRKPRFDEFAVHLITDLRPESVLAGSLDLQALLSLYGCGCSVKMTALTRLHAKVYVADYHAAWITSANLTTSALDRNFEYGVLFDEPAIVATVHADLLAYARVGADASRQQLLDYSTAMAALQQQYREQQRAADRRFRQEFKSKLEAATTEAIRLQIGNRTAHAVFGDALLYLLRSGPMTTKELHPKIQALLPELCDDEHDRVIDGRHFGKLWKHHVRTAQQHLKRAGLVEIEHGQWHLRKQDS